jgi:lactoylglutathione lyase
MNTFIRQTVVMQEKYSNAFMGAGPETDHFALELTYNYGVDHYDIGTGFGHFALAHPDVYSLVDSIKKEGGVCWHPAL